MEGLTTSLIAWKQFESGLNEFNEALGKDTGTLKRLTGVLELGTDDDAITNNLAHDVKEVAKRLSENQSAIAMAAAQQVIAHRTLVCLIAGPSEWCDVDGKEPIDEGKFSTRNVVLQ